MALPPGITPKTVTVGVASFFDGTLAEGTATITAPVNVIHNPSNRPIFSSRMSKRFVDGEASFDLAPTDATGLNRVDWTYKLNVVVQGAIVQPDPIYFTLPEAGPDMIDLDSLVPVPSSAGTPISVAVLTAEDLDGYAAQYIGDEDSATRAAIEALELGGGLDDAGVAGLVSDPESAASVALRAAFGAVVGESRFGESVALLGDSITDNNSGSSTGTEGNPTNQTRVRGYFVWANMLLGGRMRWVKNSDARWEFGQAGLTTQQIIDGDHVDNLVAAGPDWCIEASGTNSIQANAGALATFNQRRTIWEQLRAAGIRVVVTTVLPRTSLNATQAQAVRDHNRMVRNYVAMNPGVILCDWHAAWTDPATGGQLSGITEDGTHPDGPGASILGHVLADALRPHVPACDRMPDPFDAANMLRHTGQANFVGGTTIASNWAVSGVGSGVTYVASKVARTDLIPGEVQRLAVTDASYAGMTLQGNTGANGVANGWFTPGVDYVFGLMEFSTVAADPWDIRHLSLIVNHTSASGTATAMASSSAERSAYTRSLRRPESGVLVTPTMLIPAGSIQVKLNFTVAGTGTFDLSRAALVRVTPDDIATFGRDAFGLPPA